MNVAASYQCWIRPKHTNKIGLAKSNSLTLVVFYYILPAFHFQKAPRYHHYVFIINTFKASVRFSDKEGESFLSNLWLLTFSKGGKYVSILTVSKGPNIPTLLSSAMTYNQLQQTRNSTAYHLHKRPYFTPSTSKKHAPNKGADNITNL